MSSLPIGLPIVALITEATRLVSGESGTSTARKDCFTGGRS